MRDVVEQEQSGAAVGPDLDDGDGAIDYSDDSGCASAEDNTETSESSTCNDEQTIIKKDDDNI